MRSYVLICIVGILTSCGTLLAGPIIIDHTSVGAVASLPQATLDKVSTDLNFYFAHASVGTNMMTGLASLASQNPSRYKLVGVADDGTPPTTTTKGKVYEYARGNPAWQTKVDNFKTYINNGWANKVDVVLNKFCYIDPAVTLQYYAISNVNSSAMSQLEAAYPNTRFVYMTIPLTTDSNADNISRNTFNDALRQWVITNNKILFDIADIESHNLAGVESTFVSGGKTYDKLYSGFSSDGGHLNDAGQKQVALGFYALGAALVPEPVSLLLLTGAAVPMLLRRRHRRCS
ncbi:MAG: hypothetical protein EHM48_01320 [Planctomycetaceae bacterium]|nr:MAG: hypothetical protein EHM48_01320 [Planctomycetaceae bacterium]